MIKIDKVKDRFMKKVSRPVGEGCWIWQGGIAKATGYGRFWLLGETLGSHVASYRIFNGEIPKEKNTVIMHSCDNRCCVNPSHLTVGTKADNLKDCMDKGRFVFTIPPVHIGTANTNAKLNEDKVREIRKSPKSANSICKDYGVSKYCILSIRNGKTWKHVN